jgi:beta-glucosidase-like glycosyl hydrolase
MASLNSSVPGTVPQTRLDDAVRRILRIKYRLNLFENAKSNATLRSEFGGAAHRDVARECVRKSLVLLKNEDNALPLVAVRGGCGRSVGKEPWRAVRRVDNFMAWKPDNPSIVGRPSEGLQSIGKRLTYDLERKRPESGQKQSL